MFYLLSKDGAKKTYTPIAYRNTENIKGLLIYTFPDVPDVAPVQDKEEYGWYGLYFSAGETNLLLAEFKLLGANLPMTAQQYLSAGVEMSVRGYDLFPLRIIFLIMIKPTQAMYTIRQSA